MIMAKWNVRAMLKARKMQVITNEIRQGREEDPG
jgi:hypothetical protein